MSYVPVWRATTRALAELGCAAFFIGGVAWTSLGAMMLNPLEERFPRPPLPQTAGSAQRSPDVRARFDALPEVSP